MLASVKVGKVASADVVVVGVFAPKSKGSTSKKKSSKKKASSGGGARPRLDAETEKLDTVGAINAALQRPEASGGVGQVLEAHTHGDSPRTLVLGLGKRDSFDRDALFNAIGSLGRELAKMKAGKVLFELEGAIDAAGLDATHAGRAIGEALGLLMFDTNAFRGSATANTPDRPSITVSASTKQVRDGISYGIGIAGGANLARLASHTPPNIATPNWMAEQAQKLAKETGMTCKVIRGAQLEKEKLAGHINVGKASENPPCMVRLEYTPEKPKRGAKPVVMVGKTITYDTGGLSIKPTSGMAGMKRDKDGGCGVLGAMKAIATTVKPRVPVVGILVCAENCISDEAYRPDDIIEFRNGVTVEITNTDAEGRLVLADGLAWSCDKEKPGALIDMATLTGGVVVALGSVYAGLWCEHDELRDALMNASGASGERLWRLPLHGDYKEMMRSTVADVWNSAPVREAHPIQGAAFLSYFVDEDVPWAHIDIAGVHAVEKDKGPYAANTATGFGVRLVSAYVESL